jgi:hypothetical protein
MGVGTRATAAVLARAMVGEGLKTVIAGSSARYRSNASTMIALRSRSKRAAAQSSRARNVSGSFNRSGDS